ncbi:hypothetical protein P7C73_g6253, partial [Tremellales sp. Uapishka_1]
MKALPPPPRQPRSRGSHSPDTRPPNRQFAFDGPDTALSQSSIPIGAQQPNPNYFLPPGARPPSPQARSGTPPRPIFSTTTTHHSQTSLNGPYGTSVSSHADMDSHHIPSTTRDRGYSSASTSGRASDHEVPQGTSPNVSSARHLSAQNPYNSRSPLVNNAYQQEPFGNHIPFPVASPQRQVLASDPYPAADEYDVSRGREKEKKKFWGVPTKWGEKKDKGKEKMREVDSYPRMSLDDGRRSTDGWRDSESQSHSAHDHGLAEVQRGRLLGVDFASGKDAALGGANDVTTAIRLLCSDPEISISAILDVCERINHSSPPEAVTKEAARSLRKEFKGGDDVQRRTAARVWMVMMQNVGAKGFRQHATNKKFMSVLEPLLLAPIQKQTISPATHRLLTDVLGGLTYQYGGDKGCEGLGEMWRRIKLPQESDNGAPFTDSTLYTPELMAPPRMSNQLSPQPSPPQSLPASRYPSSPSLQQLADLSLNPPPPSKPLRPSSPGSFGPGYARLPDHGEDMRRLMDECTAAKETARVLSDALVYTKPEELESKDVIREFYRKCFLAHESLSNQMDWAQSEAARSQSSAAPDQRHGNTIEERALASLFESHGLLTEALQQHEDLERMATDERELREVSERSKKDTRMDRNQPGLFAPEQNNFSSSSRSPSPQPHSRLPASQSPNPPRLPLPIPQPQSHSHPLPHPATKQTSSRGPSPDSQPLPHPPKFSQPPSRSGSPLGKTRVPGPRPLPNPFKAGHTASNQSLKNPPPRGGSGSTADGSFVEAEEELAPVKPSRKALGKRRAVVDEDNHFNPDDMFVQPATQSDSEPSEDSITADDIHFAKPVVYAYDAYQERVKEDLAVAGRAAGRS